MIDQPPRFPPLTPEMMSERQKELAGKVLGFSLNGLAGPHNMMMRSPDAAERFQAMGEYLRFQTGFADRLVELAILVHARLWSDPYEWMLHAPRAAKAGISEAAIAAIEAGRAPADLAGDEAAIFHFTLELVRDRRVGDAAFAEAMRHFGARGVTDLTVMLGQYATISMILAVSGDGAAAAPPILPVARPFADVPPR